ncbi:uncharacterized protein V1516DRAFT_696316 [Lipomyces oligophaga]|uniref:uncharacterized protein n=1 Tax=Lipomyces oligophaga TaxID=45792 RepID=UPI0034CD7FBB
MRYGYVLAQYAVPEWKAYAVNYDELKALFKQCSLRSSGPSHEDVVFAALTEQLERINIFVRSKTGELDRRISNCNKAIQTVANNDAARTYPVSNAQRQKPVVKIESEMDDIYHELQNLARFVSAHKIAFRKLVKAYNKWSGTTSLSVRFSVVLDNPKCFVKRDFTPTIVELSSLYDSIRRYFQSSMRFLPAHASFATDDTSFETQSSFATGSTVFWVHDDNFIELQIFLLKYLSIIPNESYFRRNLLKSADYSIQCNTRMVYINSSNALTNSNSPKKFYDEVGRVLTNISSESPEAILCTPPAGATLTGKRKYIESIVNSTASTTELQQLDSSGKSAVSWISKHFAHPSVAVASSRTRFELIGTSGTNVWATLDQSVRFRKAAPLSGWTESVDSGSWTPFSYSVLELKWQGAEPTWLFELRNSHTVYEVQSYSYFSHATWLLGLSEAEPNWSKFLHEDIHKLPQQGRIRTRGLHSSRNQGQMNTISSSSSSSQATIEGTSSVETPEEGGPIAGPLISIPRQVTPIKHNRAASIISSIFSRSSPRPEPVNVPSGVLKRQIPPEAAEIARVGRSRRGPGRAPRKLSIGPADNGYWNEFDNPEDNESAFYVDMSNEPEANASTKPLQKLSGWSNGLWSRVSNKVDSIQDAIEESNLPPSRRAAADAEREGLLSNQENHESIAAATELMSLPSTEDLESGLSGLSLHGSPNGSIFDKNNSEAIDRALTMFYAMSFSISLTLVGILDGIIFGGQQSGAPVYVLLLASIGIVFAECIALAGVIAFIWRRNVPGFIHQMVVFLSMLAIVCSGMGGILYILF